LLDDVNDIFLLIASNIDDELNLLKNEEIHLKLLKEDLNDDQESSINMKNANSFISNLKNFELSEINFTGSTKIKGINSVDLDDNSSNRQNTKNDYKIILNSDFEEKNTYINLKTHSNKTNNKFKPINLNIKEIKKINNEKGAKTPNKTPIKTLIKNNIPCANKSPNTNLLKYSYQNKDQKKN